MKGMVRKTISLVGSFLLGFLTLLLLFPPLWSVSTILQEDIYTKLRFLGGLLLLSWLIFVLWVWLKLKQLSLWWRWFLTVGAAFMVLFLGPLLTPTPKTDWDRLEELGFPVENLDDFEDSFKRLPVEEKIELFLDVAQYEPTHPKEAVKYMARVLKGVETQEPVMWTIIAHLPRAQAGDRYSRRVVSWLSSDALMKGTKTEPLFIKLLYDPRNHVFVYVEDIEAFLIAQHPEIREHLAEEEAGERWKLICSLLAKTP